MEKGEKVSECLAIGCRKIIKLKVKSMKLSADWFLKNTVKIEIQKRKLILKLNLLIASSIYLLVYDLLGIRWLYSWLL